MNTGKHSSGAQWIWPVHGTVGAEIRLFAFWFVCATYQPTRKSLVWVESLYCRANKRGTTNMESNMLYIYMRFQTKAVLSGSKSSWSAIPGSDHCAKGVRQGLCGAEEQLLPEERAQCHGAGEHPTRPLGSMTCGDQILLANWCVIDLWRLWGSFISPCFLQNSCHFFPNVGCAWPGFGVSMCGTRVRPNGVGRNGHRWSG